MGQVIRRVLTTILEGDNPVFAALKDINRPATACFVTSNGVWAFDDNTAKWAPGWDLLILPDAPVQHACAPFAEAGELLWLRHQNSRYLGVQTEWLGRRLPQMKMIAPVGFSHDEHGYETYLKHVGNLIRSAGKSPTDYERIRDVFDGSVLRFDAAAHVVRLMYAAAAVLWDVGGPEMRLGAAKSALGEIEHLKRRIRDVNEDLLVLGDVLGEVEDEGGEVKEETRIELGVTYRSIQKLLVRHLIA